MLEKCTMALAPGHCFCFTLWELFWKENVKSFNSNRLGNQKVSSFPIWHLSTKLLTERANPMPHNATTIQRVYPHDTINYFSFPHCNWLQLLPASCAPLPCLSSFVLFAKLRLNFCTTIVDNFICIGLIFATWTGV